MCCGATLKISEGHFFSFQIKWRRYFRLEHRGMTLSDPRCGEELVEDDQTLEADATFGCSKSLQSCSRCLGSDYSLDSKAIGEYQLLVHLNTECPFKTSVMLR